MSQIKFESNGTTYTLEFDRNTAMQAERMFDISIGEVQAGKISMLPSLFAAAFMKHHPNIKNGVVSGMLDKMSDKAGLYQMLAAMYLETASSVLEEPDAGNALTWKAM